MIETGLTFDDILLIPGYSKVLPKDVSTHTSLGKGFSLASPILSAAMDTVTESQMAIALSQFGGLGVIHKNMTATQQAEEVEKVKRFESGVVTSPITVLHNMTVGDVLQIKKQSGFSGLPVIDNKNVVLGIVTNRDLRFETRMNRPIRQLMTPQEKLVTVRPGFSMREVKELMHSHRIERVIVIDNKGVLKGLVTVKDILREENFPNASKDDKKRLRAAAAVGIDIKERAGLLIEAGADALVVDSAHGHSQAILSTVAILKKKYGAKTLIIAGNIATQEGAKALTVAGADVIKVGIGPGSICTTRMISGVGVPQFSAIVEAVKSRKRHYPKIIADGGLRYSGDIAKAIAAGADAVMVGSMLAGTDEAPGEMELYQGRAYKRYRGMGSLGAMRRGGGERYFQATQETAKMVPEGVEGRVPYKGPVANVLYQITGGVRSAMGYVGAADLQTLKKTRYIRVSPASTRESHVHDVQITREAPNYQTNSPK